MVAKIARNSVTFAVYYIQTLFIIDKNERICFVHFLLPAIFSSL